MLLSNCPSKAISAPEGSEAIVTAVLTGGGAGVTFGAGAGVCAAAAPPFENCEAATAGRPVPFVTTAGSDLCTNCLSVSAGADETLTAAAAGGARGTSVGYAGSKSRGVESSGAGVPVCREEARL